MPTLKAVTKDYKRTTDGKYRIFIRVIHNSQVNYIATDYYSDGKLKLKNPKVNRNIAALLFEYNTIIDDIGPDIRHMGVNELVTRLRNKDIGISFTKYAEKRTETLKKEGRYSYATTYEATLKHLKNDIKFKDITPAFLEDFDRQLKLRGCKVNTRRIYLNNMRAIFNHALDKDVIQLPSPFRKFRVRQEKPQKRSINVDMLRKLRDEEYPPAQQRSVDIFFLILYLIGINLKDLLYIIPDQIQDGRLNYRRAKTGTLFSVKIHPKCQVLLDRWKGEKYLLRFLDDDDSYEHYKNFLKETNKGLRKAFGGKISTYYARHSWSSIALDIGIPFEVISMALGHSMGNKMTETYLTFNMSKVDEANEKVIQCL